MSGRKLSDLPRSKPIKSSVDLYDARCWLAGLEKDNFNAFRKDSGLLQLVHMLCEELAEVKEELKQLKK